MERYILNCALTAVDVLVVGGGPSGLIAAAEAARRGARTMVLEEHGEVGRPAHCAGLVSVEGLRRLGVRGSEGFIQGLARGAVLHSPSGLEVEVDAGRYVAYVIDREAFDRELAGRAVDEGAELRCRAKALRLLMGRRVEGVEARVDGGVEEVAAGVVVDAEGARFKLSRQAGLPTPDPFMLYPAAQLELKGGDVAKGFVELFFGEAWAPGFFAWIVPTDGGCRVGVASRRGGCRFLLERFVKKHPKASTRLRGAAPMGLAGGLLVLGGAAARTYVEGMMVVGDAAGHVKPTTGGGVVFGGLAASVAGEEAASYSLNGDAEALERYEARWRRLIGRELSWMARLRRYLSSLSDEGYERLFKAAALLNLGGELARVGDMDLHALTAFRLSINPRLAPLAALVALGVLKESFKAKPIEGWGRRGVGSCLGR